MTSPITDAQVEARRLFANELERFNERGLANMVRAGTDNSHGGQAAVAAIVAALAAAQAAGTEWRPIETAPKNGSHFLACEDNPPYGEYWTFDQKPPAVVHWWPHDTPGFYTSVDETAPEHPFPATHWMPLPRPPPSCASEDKVAATVDRVYLEQDDPKNSSLSEPEPAFAPAGAPSEETSERASPPPRTRS